MYTVIFKNKTEVEINQEIFDCLAKKEITFDKAFFVSNNNGALLMINLSEVVAIKPVKVKGF